MEILKHNRRATLLIAAGVALAVLAALTLLHRSHGDDGDQGGSVIGTPGPDTSGTDILKPSSPTGKTGASAKSKKGAAGLGSGFGSAEGIDLAGLPGHSLESELPVIRIQLSVQSADPIGTVGYVIPTSREHPSGTATGVGTSWSLATTGYGRPDYARIFFSAGPTGTPITCTITINGKVTEHRSTSGPYGRMMCQG